MNVIKKQVLKLFRLVPVTKNILCRTAPFECSTETSCDGISFLFFRLFRRSHVLMMETLQSEIRRRCSLCEWNTTIGG